MDEIQTKQDNLLDTTDCLEAVGVFRGWKNAFFTIVLLCLIVLQASFWLVNTGYVKSEEETKAAEAAFPVIVRPPADKHPAPKPPKTWPPPAKELVVPLQEDQAKQSVGKSGEIEKAAEEAAAEPNKPAESVCGGQQKTGLPFDITFRHLCWTIRIANGLLILTAVLYCLSMLFCLKVSLIGRLGGINHISRAFFLSLILAILLLPWQVVLDGIFPGVIYTPCELVRQCPVEQGCIFATITHYLRFTGYWLLAVLLLIFSQVRSSRWAKAVLRRLEVI